MWFFVNFVFFGEGRNAEENGENEENEENGDSGGAVCDRLWGIDN